MFQIWNLEILSSFFTDANRDGIITEEEFVALPPGEVVEEEWKDADKIWVEERRKEFKTSIDLDGDGKCDMEELKVWRILILGLSGHGRILIYIFTFVI